ncbi:MAG: SIMPL domain-containing protein [Methanothrix sp.]
MSSKLILWMCLAALAMCAAASAQDSSLRVIGVGTVQVPADTTIIAIEVQNSSANLSQAYEVNSLHLNQTEEALLAAGVKREEIDPLRSRGHISFHKAVCDTVNNTTSCRKAMVNAATMQMLVNLKTSDSNRTEEVIAAAESAGAEASIWGYELSDPSSGVDQARKKALEDAREKAEYYAQSYGLTLSESMEIEETEYPDIEMGPSGIWDRPWRMGRMHWMGPFPMMHNFWGGSYIPSGMAEVTAYVRVTYKVQTS